MSPVANARVLNTDLSWRSGSLEALLDSSALVSIHAPLTPHTHHLISHDSLARLRGKYLINTARGAIVDPDALASAMAQPDDREAALITFLVTASGMSFLGLSAAFWGLVFGIAAHLLLNVRRNCIPAASPLRTTNLAKEDAIG